MSRREELQERSEIDVRNAWVHGRSASRITTPLVLEIIATGSKELFWNDDESLKGGENFIPDPGRHKRYRIDTYVHMQTSVSEYPAVTRI